MISNINLEVGSWSMAFYRILCIIRTLEYSFLEFYYYFFLKTFYVFVEFVFKRLIESCTSWNIKIEHLDK